MRRFSGLHYPRITKKEKELEIPTKNEPGKIRVHKTVMKNTLTNLIRKQIKSSKEKPKTV